MCSFLLFIARYTTAATIISIRAKKFTVVIAMSFIVFAFCVVWVVVTLSSSVWGGGGGAEVLLSLSLQLYIERNLERGRELAKIQPCVFRLEYLVTNGAMQRY